MARAVSRVVGFVLVFAIVVTTAGVAYSGGAAELETLRDVEQTNSAERGFDAMARNVEDLVRDGAPRRVTSLDLGGGTLTYGDPATMNVTLVDEGTSYSATYRPIRYEAANGERVVYSNGLVARGDADGYAVVRAPPLVFGTDAVVPFVVTRPAESASASVGGRTTATVRTTAVDRQAFARHTDGPYSVRVNVTTSRTGVWRRTLEAHGLACSTVGRTVTCETTADRVHISLTRVNVAFAG